MGSSRMSKQGAVDVDSFGRIEYSHVSVFLHPAQVTVLSLLGGVLATEAENAYIPHERASIKPIPKQTMSKELHSRRCSYFMECHYVQWGW